MATFGRSFWMLTLAIVLPLVAVIGSAIPSLAAGIMIEPSEGEIGEKVRVEGSGSRTCEPVSRGNSC